MKKILFCEAILFSCLVYNSADAQIHVNIGFNIGSQPEWGPVGYDHADYYYMPDIDTYYDVPNHQYIYYQNNSWIRTGGLPPRYRNYDLYHGYKVVVNQRNPWEHEANIRARYAGYRGRHDQQIIRESNDERYRNHWNGDRGQGGDRGRGWGNGQGGGRDHGQGGDQGRGWGNGQGGGRDHGQDGDHGQGGDRGHGDHGGR